MKQTKLVSMIEVTLNVLSGIVVAMLVWKFIIPTYFPRMAGPVAENFAVTLTFTFFSVLRSYGWRRFFANGLNYVITSWVGRWWNRHSAGGKNS